MFTDDPIADFMAYDAERESELERLPVCSCCEEPIQDDFFYEINDEVICVHCMNEYFRKDVDCYAG